MIDLLASLALIAAQSDAMDTVECRITAEGGNTRVRALRADCPDGLDPADAQAVQAAADALVARVELPFRVVYIGGVTQTLPLVRHGDGSWDLERPISLHKPIYRATSGATRIRRMCAGRALLTPAGVAEDPQWRCNRASYNGENIREDSRAARRLADQMEDARWIMPLGLEQGCADITEVEMGFATGRAPEVDEAERPNYNAFSHSAIHQDHPMNFPLAGRDRGYSATCEVRYDYDAQGFVHNVETGCTLVTLDGVRLEPSQDGDIRVMYEEVVSRALRRTRLEPAAAPFEGLRAEDKTIDFGFTSVSVGPYGYH
jgi:hypothetical protein